MKELRTVLSQKFPLIDLRLYGSKARGEGRQDSDLDVMIETGLEIQVSHFPPGTSEWNKIEHRLFSAISLNWRGRPLINHEVIISLIESTTTKTGLKVLATLDTNHYPKGIKVSDADLKALSHHPEPFHGEWNYTIKKHG